MMADRRTSPLLGLSVAWGYGFAFVLLLFIFLILVPDAEGPSPWDPTAFRKATIELIANFRILDELADLSIVRVADVGAGLLSVDLEMIAVSNRRFGTAPFYLALVCAALCLFLRAVRLRLLTRHLGVSSEVKGQLSAYFFGRGLNLFFPFGPGELGAIRTLIDNGAPPDAAAQAMFHQRVFEILAIVGLLVCGFVYLGWGGAVEAFIWTVILIVGVVSLTRPLGRPGAAASGRGPLGGVWSAFRGDRLIEATSELLRTPGFFLGVLALSLVTLGLEVLAFWNIKQAFSSPLDAYILMKDLTLVPFAIVIAVAGLARVIPYTFAGAGVVELVMVVMFRVFDEGFLVGATVAVLCAVLLNGMTLLFFLAAMWVSRCTSILETWQAFFERSATVAMAQPDLAQETGQHA